MPESDPAHDRQSPPSQPHEANLTGAPDLVIFRFIRQVLQAAAEVGAEEVLFRWDSDTALLVEYRNANTVTETHAYPPLMREPARNALRELDAASGGYVEVPVAARHFKVSVVEEPQVTVCRLTEG